MKTKYIACIAAVAATAHVCAEQWFGVTSRDQPGAGTLVEVDLDTVRLRAGTGEAVIRVSFDKPQAHGAGFLYRSFVASAHIDCVRNALTLVSAAYYTQPAQQGARAGADSSGRESGMPARLLESIPAHTRQALLKAACAVN